MRAELLYFFSDTDEICCSILVYFKMFRTVLPCDFITLDCVCRDVEKICFFHVPGKSNNI